jgi:hypothetical protein
MSQALLAALPEPLPAAMSRALLEKSCRLLGREW